MRNFSIFNDLLILEILTLDQQAEKRLELLVDRFSVFSRQGVLKLGDRWFFILGGVAHTHPVANFLQQEIEKEGFLVNVFSVKCFQYRFVPLHQLFDFEERKWLKGYHLNKKPFD